MPRYFIDTDDGCADLVDADGHELADAWAARALALRALSDLIRGDPSKSDQRAFSTRVRAEDGSTLYSADLTLAGAWSIAPPAAR